MVETFDVSITPYGLTRRTFVYLPDDWQTSGKKYPVLYMFDGHNLFFDSTATYGTCWGLKEYCDAHPNWIIAAPECNHEGNKRLEEYCPYQSDWFGGITGTGHEYMEWLTKEFKPMMDKRYPTLPGRANTAIGGSSMGGLMSLYAITAYNKVFSKAACLSPSVRLCMPELRQEIANATIHPGTRVYRVGAKKRAISPVLWANTPPMRWKYAVRCWAKVPPLTPICSRTAPTAKPAGPSRCLHAWTFCLVASMSKKKKRSTPTAAPAEPAKAEHTQPEEPAVSSTARWMGALCYLSILILIPACTKWRQDEFVRFHLNQGLMVLMLATICAALGFVPVLEQVALSLTLLVDVLSLVGLITALRRRAAPLPFIGLLVARFHPF